MTKIPYKSSLREGDFILAHGFQVFSPQLLGQIIKVVRALGKAFFTSQQTGSREKWHTGSGQDTIWPWGHILIAMLLLTCVLIMISYESPKIHFFTRSELICSNQLWKNTTDTANTKLCFISQQITHHKQVGLIVSNPKIPEESTVHKK